MRERRGGEEDEPRWKQKRKKVEKRTLIPINTPTIVFSLRGNRCWTVDTRTAPTALAMRWREATRLPKFEENPARRKKTEMLAAQVCMVPY